MNLMKLVSIGLLFLGMTISYAEDNLKPEEIIKKSYEKEKNNCYVEDTEILTHAQGTIKTVSKNYYKTLEDGTKAVRYEYYADNELLSLSIVLDRVRYCVAGDTVFKDPPLLLPAPSKNSDTYSNEYSMVEELYEGRPFYVITEIVKKNNKLHEKMVYYISKSDLAEYCTQRYLPDGSLKMEIKYDLVDFDREMPDSLFEIPKDKKMVILPQGKFAEVEATLKRSADELAGIKNSNQSVSAVPPKKDYVKMVLGWLEGPGAWVLGGGAIALLILAVILKRVRSSRA